MSTPKKALPHQEVILAYFGTMPKQGTSTWKGVEKPTVGFRFQIADAKYPDLIGYDKWLNSNAVIGSGDKGGRPTKTYELCEAMAGHRLGPEWDYVDTVHLTENEWQGLYGYYWLMMEEPVFKEDGSLHFQDIKDVYNPTKFPFPLDGRKVEVDQLGRSHSSQPLGLPKAKTPPPATTPTPATPTGLGLPGPQPRQTDAGSFVPPKAAELSLEDVVAQVGFHYKKGGDYRKLASDFAVEHKAAAVSKLPEPEMRLLLTLLEIEENKANGPQYVEIVETQLKTWNKPLHQLDRIQAELIRKRLSDVEEDVPF